MRTLEYLLDPALRGLFVPGMVTGLAIAVVTALLSPLVVLKRLAFSGQGISHAAFGGIGVSVALATLGVWWAATPTGQSLVVLACCLAAALVVDAMLTRGSSEADTAIGIVLVGSMTLGALLIAVSLRAGGAPPVNWESILFGSVLEVSEGAMWLSIVVTIGVVAALWAWRRPMLSWAFDETVASATGVRVTAMRRLLIVMLAVTIVVTMRLAGVVLATALLVLPGATAARLSTSLAGVHVSAVAVSVGAMAAGWVLSFEAGLPPGASIVTVLIAAYAGAAALGAGRGRWVARAEGRS